MTERINHVARSLLVVETDRESTLGWETADAQHLANIAEAQVHATLALVEQQRIANLIALHKDDSVIVEPSEWGWAEGEIRSLLGLS